MKRLLLALLISLFPFSQNIEGAESSVENLVKPFVGKWESKFIDFSDLSKVPFLAPDTTHEDMTDYSKGMKVTFCVRYNYDNSVGGWFVKGDTTVTAKVNYYFVVNDKATYKVIDFFVGGEDRKTAKVYTDIYVDNDSLIGKSAELFRKRTTLNAKLVASDKASIEFYDWNGKYFKLDVFLVAKDLFSC